MQLSDIVGEVRKTLGEVETLGYGTQQAGQGTWDNSQIISYINEAIGLLSHMVRLEGSSAIQLNTTTNNYALPSDCLEDGVRKVLYNTQNTTGPIPVKPLDLDQFEKMLVIPPYTSSGMLFHYFYTVWGGNILFTPYPQLATDTVTLYYYKTLPTLENATDVPALPARFHLALVYFALARCQEAVEEENLKQAAMQQYNIIANQLRTELSRKSRDRNRVRAK